MKKYILLIVFFSATFPWSIAQQNAMQQSAEPAQTAAAADAYAAKGRFERVMVYRFKNGVDLLQGLENMVKQENLKNAVILSGIGSVSSYRVHQISCKKFPNAVVEEKDSPSDIVSMNGHVINGRVHSHITLADPTKALGGHLESGTKVWTFAIVTVGVLSDDMDLSRMDDANYK